MCQPGRPLPHGLSQAGSPGFAVFHRAKSPGDRFLEPAAPPSPCCSSAERLLSLPYRGLASHVEEDIAVRRVGESLGDQRLRELDDARHVLGRLGHVVDLIDAQRPQVVEIVDRHLGGDVGHRDPAFVLLLDQLVVDVGDVHDPGDLVAAVGEVPLDRVEDDRADHVADVGFLVDRRSAEIDANLAGLDRHERLLAFRQRAIDLNALTWGPRTYVVLRQESRSSWNPFSAVSGITRTILEVTKG